MLFWCRYWCPGITSRCGGVFYKVGQEGCAFWFTADHCLKLGTKLFITVSCVEFGKGKERQVHSSYLVSVWLLMEAIEWYLGGQCKWGHKHTPKPVWVWRLDLKGCHGHPRVQ